MKNIKVLEIRLIHKMKVGCQKTRTLWNIILLTQWHQSLNHHRNHQMKK